VRAQSNRLGDQRDQNGIRRDADQVRAAQACGGLSLPDPGRPPCEKVREDGVIESQAVLVAIGINWEGKRQILEVTRALCAETHEVWLEDNRCIDMDMLSRAAPRAAQESRIDLRP
jgi:hypothetical protein